MTVQRLVETGFAFVWRNSIVTKYAFISLFFSFCVFDYRILLLEAPGNRADRTFLKDRKILKKILKKAMESKLWVFKIYFDKGMGDINESLGFPYLLLWTFNI